MKSDRTLLAHLVPKLTSQVEDAATEALAFILNKSDTCRQALVDQLGSENFPMADICRVATQVVFEDRCRPDMAGYDQKGTKRLLVESKFWASLGKGQASGYFRHLEEEKEGPGVLLFIVPDSRIDTLWTEIKLQMDKRCIELGGNEATARMRKAKVDSSDKRVMLTSWSNILEVLQAQLAGGDPTVEFEIAQLQGLVDRIEMDYTKYFSSLDNADLAADFPRRLLSFMRLVDETVEQAQADGWVSDPKAMAPLGGGYGKNIHLKCTKVWFGVYLRKWAQHGESPLWVWPWKEEDRVVLRNHFRTPDGNHFPVDLPLGVDYRTVLNKTISQLKAMGDVLCNGVRRR